LTSLNDQSTSDDQVSIISSYRTVNLRGNKPSTPKQARISYTSSRKLPPLVSCETSLSSSFSNRTIVLFRDIKTYPLCNDAHFRIF
jgi:hypothetical protein